MVVFSYLIIDYGHCFEWNYNVKRALLGSPYDNVGRELINKLKENYPILSSTLTALDKLLINKDLQNISDNIRDNAFVKEFSINRTNQI